MGLQLITPPDELPLTLADVKSYLRIPGDDVAEDDDLNELLAFASEWVAEETGLAIGEGIYRLTLDRFPCEERKISLPKPPLISVETVKYLSGGSLATFAASNYTVDTTGKPGRIVLKSSASWPVTDDVANAVQIDFTAGYVDAPYRVRQAIRWMVAHAWENREPVNVGNITSAIPMTLKAMIDSLTFRGYVA